MLVALAVTPYHSTTVFVHRTPALFVDKRGVEIAIPVGSDRVSRSIPVYPARAASRGGWCTALGAALVTPLIKPSVG